MVLGVKRGPGDVPQHRLTRPAVRERLYAEVPHGAEEDVQEEVGRHPQPRRVIDGDERQPQGAERQILKWAEGEECQRAGALVPVVEPVEQGIERAGVCDAVQQIHEEVHPQQQPNPAAQPADKAQQDTNQPAREETKPPTLTPDEVVLFLEIKTVEAQIQLNALTPPTEQEEANAGARLALLYAKAAKSPALSQMLIGEVVTKPLCTFSA